MNKLLLKIKWHFLITAFLISCSPGEKQNSNSEIIQTAAVELPLAGCWISEGYFKSIRQFKSPNKAQNGAQFIVLPARTLEPTTMIYNFHEGSPNLKVIKEKNNFELCQIDDNNLDTVHTPIEIISETKIKIGNSTFIKIDAARKGNHELVLEELLFKGTYLTKDGNEIEFKKNGRITGLNEFQYYEITEDYYDAGFQVDQVGLGKTEETLIPFGFKFNKDTLNIYQLHCLENAAGRCTEVEFGALTYKLVKLK
jgi:hypothetical protein